MLCLALGKTDVLTAEIIALPGKLIIDGNGDFPWLDSRFQALMGCDNQSNETQENYDYSDKTKSEHVYYQL